MDKKCGNCAFRNTNEYCIPKSSHVSHERAGCDLHEFKKEYIDSMEESEQKPVKKGKRQVSFDANKLKELYKDGLNYKDIASKLGFKSASGVFYQIEKLIKSGELKKRFHISNNKRTTKTNIKPQGTKLEINKILNEVPNYSTPSNATIKICPQCGQDVRHPKDYYEFKRTYESLPEEKRKEVYRYLKFLQFKQKKETNK